MTRRDHLARLARAYSTAEDRPVLSYIVGRGWLVAALWAVDVGGYRLRVPAGFGPFDLASVPRMLWWLIAPFELSLSAPLAHDVLYRFRGQLPPQWLTPGTRVSRRIADRWFLLLMAREGVPRLRRRVAWVAVRLAGWWPWWRSGRPAGKLPV